MYFQSLAEVDPLLGTLVYFAFQIAYRSVCVTCRAVFIEYRMLCSVDRIDILSIVAYDTRNRGKIVLAFYWK